MAVIYIYNAVTCEAVMKTLLFGFRTVNFNIVGLTGAGAEQFIALNCFCLVENNCGSV